MSTWTWRQGPGEWSDRSGQGPSSQPQWQVQLYDKTQVLGAHLKSLKNHSSPTTAELQCMTDSGKASLGQACWHPVQEALLPEQPSGLSCPCGLLLHLGPPPLQLQPVSSVQGTVQRASTPHSVYSDVTKLRATVGCIQFSWNVNYFLYSWSSPTVFL